MATFAPPPKLLALFRQLAPDVDDATFTANFEDAYTKDREGTIEGAATEVYDRFYKGQVLPDGTPISREVFDGLSGLSTWRQEQPSFLGALGRGVAEGAKQFVAGVGQVGAEATGVGLETTTTALTAPSSPDTPYVTWEEAKNDWTNFPALFALTTAQSLPTMAALMHPIGMGAAATSFAGQMFANIRALRQQKEAQRGPAQPVADPAYGVTPGEALAVMPIAAASMYLGKAGVENMIGKAVARQATRQLAQQSILRATGRQAITEAVTEPTQQALEGVTERTIADVPFPSGREIRAIGTQAAVLGAGSAGILTPGAIGVARGVRLLSPTPDARPEAASEMTPDARPEAASEMTPDARPEAASEMTPDARPEAASEMTPDARPEAASEMTPDARPEAASEMTPDARPEAASEMTRRPSRSVAHLEPGKTYIKTNAETGEPEGLFAVTAKNEGELEIEGTDENGMPSTLHLADPFAYESRYEEVAAPAQPTTTPTPFMEELKRTVQMMGGVDTPLSTEAVQGLRRLKKHKGWDTLSSETKDAVDVLLQSADEEAAEQKASRPARTPTPQPEPQPTPEPTALEEANRISRLLDGIGNAPLPMEVVQGLRRLREHKGWDTLSPETQDEMLTWLILADEEAAERQMVRPKGGGDAIVAVDPTTLTVDAARFQYKAGVGAHGETERLAGIPADQWNPTMAGVAVIWEAEDGTRYVVDGHQRVAFAQRVADETGMAPPFHAWVLREADGISADEARVIGAQKNIAEGSGTAVDAARVLKRDPSILKALPPRSVLVRDAQGLAALDDTLLSLVTAGRLPPAIASQIGQSVPDDTALQTALFKRFADRQPASQDEAAQIIDQIRQHRGADTTTETLFGPESTADLSLYEDRGRVLHAALKLLRDDKRVFSTLINKANAIEQAGNVLDAESNEARAAAAQTLLAHIEALANRTGPISSALTESARAVGTGRAVTHAARDFLERLNPANFATLSGLGAGRAGQEPTQPGLPNTGDATARGGAARRGGSEPPNAEGALPAAEDTQRERNDTLSPEDNYARQQELMRLLPNNIGKLEQEGRLTPVQKERMAELDALEKELPQESPEWQRLHEAHLTSRDEQLAQDRATRRQETEQRLEAAGWKVGDTVAVPKVSMLGSGGTVVKGTLKINIHGTAYIAAEGKQLDFWAQEWDRWQEPPDAEPSAAPLSPATARTLLDLPLDKQVRPSGPALAELRRDLLEELTGTRPPTSKAGMTRVYDALREALGITEEGKSGAQVENDMRDALRAIATASLPSPEDTTRVRGMKQRGGGVYQVEGPDGQLYEVAREHLTPEQQQQVFRRGQPFPVPTDLLVPIARHPALVAVHDISYDNLARTLRRGALLAPSIGVVPEGVAHEFHGSKPGIIQLVFRAGAIDPRRDMTGSDMWSPTFPRAYWQAADYDAMQRIAKAEGLRFEDRSTRIIPEDAVRDKHEASQSPLSFAEWAADYLGGLGLKPVIRVADDRNGNPRFEPATNANILAEMKREARAQAKGEVTPSVAMHRLKTLAIGTVRSLPEMRRLAKQIKQRRQIGVGHKEDALSDVLSHIDRIRDGLGRTGDEPAFGELLLIVAEHPTSPAGFTRAVTQWLNRTPDTKRVQDLYAAIDHLASLPLAYLETKPLRSVPLSDIAGAIVPPDTPASLTTALEAHGIPVRLRPGSADELARLQAGFPQVRFQRGTPRPAAGVDREQMRREVMALARTMLPPGVEVAVRETLTDEAGNPVLGRYADGLIEVALGNGLPPIGHEAGHALSELGLIQPAEKAMLLSAARAADWLGHFRVKERYGDDPLVYRNGKPTLAAYEEAYWDAFQHYLVTGEMPPAGPHASRVRQLFERIREFFRRLRARALRENIPTNPTTQGLFDAMLSGEVAARSAAIMHAGLPADKRGVVVPPRWGQAERPLPPFYSQLLRAIENGPRRATGTSWAQWLASQKSGVKSLELDDVPGFRDWLNTQTQKVHKAEVEAWVRERAPDIAVEVREKRDPENEQTPIVWEEIAPEDIPDDHLHDHPILLEYLLRKDMSHVRRAQSSRGEVAYVFVTTNGNIFGVGPFGSDIPATVRRGFSVEEAQGFLEFTLNEERGIAWEDIAPEDIPDDHLPIVKARTGNYFPWEDVVSVSRGQGDGRSVYVFVPKSGDALAIDPVRDDLALAPMLGPTMQEAQEYFAPFFWSVSGRDTSELRWADTSLNHPGERANPKEILVWDRNGINRTNPSLEEHWGDDTTDVIVHVRTSERETAAGKTLFIEEIQSDLWQEHQQNRREIEAEIDGTPEEETISQRALLDSGLLLSSDTLGLWEQRDTLRKRDALWKRLDLYRHTTPTARKNAIDSILKNTSTLDALDDFDSEYAREALIRSIWDDLETTPAERLQETEAQLAAQPPFPFGGPGGGSAPWVRLALKTAFHLAARDGLDAVAWADGAAQGRMEGWEAGAGGEAFYNQIIPSVAKRYLGQHKNWGTSVKPLAAGEQNPIGFVVPVSTAMRHDIKREGQPLYHRGATPDLFALEGVSPYIADAAEAIAPIDERLTTDILVTPEPLYTQRISRRTATTPDAIADAASFLRTEAQEVVLAVVTDKAGTIVGMLRHTQGGPAESPVYPRLLLGAAHQMPGADLVWFVHNHPAGGSHLSSADLQMHRQLAELNRGDDALVYRGMLALRGGRAQTGGEFISNFGGTPIPLAETPPPGRARRGVRVPIFVRRFAKVGKSTEAILDWDQVAERFFRQGQPVWEEHQDGPYVLLLDGQNRPVGRYRISATELQSLRYSPHLPALYQAFAQTNAASMIYLTDQGMMSPTQSVREGVSNLADFAFVAQTPLLDVVGPAHRDATELGGMERWAAKSRIGSWLPSTPAGQYVGREGGHTFYARPLPDHLQQDSSGDTEYDRQIRANMRGVTQSSDWLTDNVASAWHKATRAYESLPHTPEFAELQERMRHLQSAPGMAREMVAHNIARVLNTLKTEPDPTHATFLFTKTTILNNLAYSAEKGLELPYELQGLEDVEFERERAERQLSSAPGVREAIAVRRAINQDIRTQMIDVGVMDAERLQNTDYFHHQVLAYFQTLRAAVGQGKIKTPHWFRRKGSTKAINANYVQAEQAWQQRALIDIETKRFLNWLRTSAHNQMPAFQERARRSNAAGLLAAFKREVAGLSSTTQQDDLPGFARQLEAVTDMDGLRAFLRARGLTPSGPLKNYLGLTQSIAIRMSAMRATQDALGARVPPELRQPDQIFALAQYIADHPQDFPDHVASALGLQRAVYARQSLTKKVVGKDYLDPNRADTLIRAFADPNIPLESWQEDAYDPTTKRLTIFSSHTVPEHAASAALDLLAEGNPGDMPPDQTTKVLSMLARSISKGKMRVLGGPTQEMILDSRIAGALNNFTDPALAMGLESLARRVTTFWKFNARLFPTRAIKYLINDETGDIDGILAALGSKTPAVLRRVKEAAWELHAVSTHGQEPSDTLKEALRMGVINSGRTPDELESMLVRLQQTPAERIRANPGGFLSGYARLMGGIASYRENVHRYGLYLHYRDTSQARPRDRYGASDYRLLDALREAGVDPKIIAAKLARDALGDYQNVAQFTRTLSQFWFPFVRWTATMTTRYNHLFRNAAALAGHEGVRAGAAAGGVVAASLLGRIAVFYAGASVGWNYLFHADEEEELGPDVRNRLHLILGRLPNGEIVSLRAQGAFSDYLGWIGMEDIGAMLAGHKEMGLADMLTKIAKAPVNKVAGIVTPLVKVPLIELPSGKSFWPDVFMPHSIRDPVSHAARTFALDREINLVRRWFGTPLPSRGFADYLLRSVAYVDNPDMLALRNSRARAYKFLDTQRTKHRGLYGALYYAILYDDEVAMDLALDGLKAVGIPRRRVLQALRRRAPLAVLPRHLRQEFAQTLTPLQEQQLRRAEAVTQEVIRAVPAQQ